MSTKTYAQLKTNADPYLRLDPNPDILDPDLDRSIDLAQTQTVQDKLS
jgi:hypothetical protein